MLVAGYPHEYPADFFSIPNLPATHNSFNLKYEICPQTASATAGFCWWRRGFGRFVGNFAIPIQSLANNKSTQISSLFHKGIN